jgi:hypothetical protein
VPYILLNFMVASFCSFSVSGFLKITTERSDGVAFVSYAIRMLMLICSLFLHFPSFAVVSLCVPLACPSSLLGFSLYFSLSISLSLSDSFLLAGVPH